MSTIKADNIATLAGVSTSMANAVNGSAKAWVNFDGQFGTSPYTIANGGIRAAYNVSSVTDIGTGRWQVNITTPISTSDYAILCTIRQSGTNNNQRVYEASTITKTASAYGIASDDGGSYSDFAYVYSAVFA